MIEYKLKFELLGLKLKTTVLANSKAEAKDIVRNRLSFSSIKLNPSIKNNYYVSAEFYGKPINKQVNAQHEIEAKKIMVNLIEFIEEDIKKDVNVDFIKDFFGFK